MPGLNPNPNFWYIDFMNGKFTSKENFVNGLEILDQTDLMKLIKTRKQTPSLKKILLNNTSEMARAMMELLDV